MNQLKHIFAINVPRRVPSNAALVTCCNHQNETCKKRLPKHTPIKPHRTISSRARKLYGLKNVQYAGQQKVGTTYFQQRNKTRLIGNSTKRLPLEKTTSIEWDRKVSRRYFTGQPLKPNNVKRHNGQNYDGIMTRVKDSKESRTYGTNLPSTHYEKEPRSYAQIIANYSEAIRARSTSGIFRDTSNSNVGNDIRASPFSTLSVIYLNGRNIDRASNSFKQNVRGTNGCSNIQHNCRHNSSCTERIDYNNYKLEGDLSHLEKTSSYATMIARYSDTMDPNVVSQSNDGVISKRSSFINKTSSITFLKSNSFSSKTSDIITDEKSNTTMKHLEDTNSQSPVKVTKEEDWFKKVEGVLKELKGASGSKTNEIKNTGKSDDKHTQPPVTESAHWLDRVVKAHKKKIKERAELGTTVLAKREQHQTGTKLSEESQFRHSQEFQSAKSSNTTASEFLNRGQVDSSSASKKTSSQTPTSIGTVVIKEPQIELRMAPSQNESIVSINVDKLSKSSDPTNVDAKELSVIVSSKKAESVRTVKNNFNVSSSRALEKSRVRNDFESMHISINEETVPVKQIQFSINGKPVSEVKSIMARTGKLDVVSSMDKVEIRVPFAQDSVRVSKENVKGVEKNVRNSQPVLNLQISAKFNEPRMEQTTDTSKTERSVPNPVNHNPPKPQYSLSPKNVKSNEKSTIEDSTDTNALISRSVSGSEKNDYFSKRLKGEKMKDFGVLETNESSKVNQMLSDKSGIDVPIKKAPTRAPLSIGNINGNRPYEERTPSNMIPWWSSEDSFNRIKRKGNIPKSAFATLNTDGRIMLSEKQSIDEQQSAKSSFNSKVTSNEGFSETGNKSSGISTASSDKINNEKKTQKIENGTAAASDSQALKPLAKEKSTTNVSNINHGVNARSKPVDIKNANETDLKESNTSSRAMTRSSKEAENACTNENEKIAELEKTKKFPSKVEVFKNVKKSAVDRKNEKSVAPAKNSQDVAENSFKNEKEDKETKDNAKSLTKLSGGLTKSNLRESENNDAKDRTKSLTKLRNDLTSNVRPVLSNEKLGREDLSKKSRSINDVSSDSGIKQIFESMKPIEKRKDGTLIDYGVTVATRKKSDPLRRVPKKPADNLGIKNITSNSSRNKTPSNHERINEAKDFRAKKPPQKIVIKSERNKLINTDVKLKSEKNINNKIIEKQYGNKEKPAKSLENLKYNPKYGKKNIDLKRSGRITNAAGRSEYLKRPSSTTTGKAPLQGTLTSRPSKTSIKINRTRSPSLSNSAPFKETINPPRKKPLEKEKPLKEVKLSGPTPKNSSKDSLITENSEPEKSLQTSIDNRPSSSTNKFPKIHNKSLTKSGHLRLKESQSKTVKVGKTLSDKNIPKHSTNTSKNSASTGAAPLQGTISTRSSEKGTIRDQGRKDKKLISLDTKERNTSRTKVSKLPGNKGKGNTESNGATKVPIGPGGPKSGPFMISKIISNDKLLSSTRKTISKQGLHRKVDNADDDVTSSLPGVQCKPYEIEGNSQDQDYCPNTNVKCLYFNDIERAEKNILYSVWLQRFKDTDNLS